MDIKKSIYISQQRVLLCSEPFLFTADLTAWCHNAMSCRENTFNLAILTKTRQVELLPLT